MILIEEIYAQYLIDNGINNVILGTFNDDMDEQIRLEEQPSTAINYYGYDSLKNKGLLIETRGARGDFLNPKRKLLEIYELVDNKTFNVIYEDNVYIIHNSIISSTPEFLGRDDNQRNHFGIGLDITISKFKKK